MESNRYSFYINWLELQKNGQIDDFEFTFMGRGQFNELVSKYIDSLSAKFKEKTFLFRSTINDIRKILLAPNDHDIRDSKFRSWAKNSFKLLSIGSQHFVCEIPSNRKITSIRNNNKEIMDLPILAREDMYYEFCSAHDTIIHGGQKPTYIKLTEKWSGINQKFVNSFVNSCLICIGRKDKRNNQLSVRPIIAESFMNRIQVKYLFISFYFCYIFKPLSHYTSIVKFNFN
jgi:hypothetical protein